MTVVFRVDAGARIGMGHFTRCLSLADRLRHEGAAIRFVSRSLPVHLRTQLEQRTCPLIALEPAREGEGTGDLAHSSWLGVTQATDAEETRRGIGAESCDWLVVDHYALDARWESALRGSARRIFAIDDLADRRHDCDLLLDQNLLNDDDQRYDEKVPSHCQRLLGPRFALLRESFRAARSGISPRTGAVARALVMFGGIDRENCTAVAIEALAAAGIQVPQVDVVIGAEHARRADIESACDRHGFGCQVQPADVASIMAAADLAIGAGGVTQWERCCLGVPSLAVAAAENQREMIRESARRGLAYAVPERDRTVPALARHIAALLEDRPLRERLSRNGMDAVDGEGTRRVVDAMNAGRMSVREATADDAEAILAWRNHESVRQFARRPDPIAPPEHYAWFHAGLKDPNRVLLIGECDGVPAGVVRFDIAGGCAEISVYRVPGSPGRGLGTALVLAAETSLRRSKPHVTTITAEVLGGNEPSRRVFRSAGYRVRGAICEKRFHA